MPTVIRRGRLRIVIYPADHRPAHVHAIGPDGEAVFNLNCPAGRSEVRENFGLKRRELASIEHLINANLGELCRAWEEIHGIAQ
jgi:uncharacterized protein DUF4160